MQPVTTSFSTLQAMNIIIELEAALFNVDAVGFLGTKNAIRTGSYPAVKIISEVKDMIRDNEVSVAGIIGNKLTDKIKSFKP